ncbi:MAG TPA: FHA domain-containing protein [Planctomycetota bacterium]|nr:FHA domain-containing protein [Planctomycetota bacterium]
MSNAPLHLFGILALRHGALRWDQLRELLEDQAQDAGTPLGELARRRGLLTARQVRRLLELQRNGHADPDATTFGGLLLHNGFASLDEVGIALQAQRSAEAFDALPLGEILVGMGTIDVQKCGAILTAQRRVRGLDPAGELDYETRILPALAAEPVARPEPQGWLIQETGDDLGNLFPLSHRSVLGRLPEHDVAVPDMAASRDHAVIEYSPAARRHVITDSDSRNGTYLNGAQLVRPHALVPGDCIQIGSTIFRYVAGGGIGGGQNTIVSRLGQDAAKTARDVATRALPLLRSAASAAGETARRLLPSRKSRYDSLLERRDALLDKVGRAALKAQPDGPATVNVDRAQRKVDELRRCGEPAIVRWAERRLAEAVRQLGRHVVERGPAPEGMMASIVEIRELDAEILVLEPLPGETAAATPEASPGA